VLQSVVDFGGLGVGEQGGIYGGKAAADPDKVFVAGDAGKALGKIFERAE
jgi:hypothetical protein